MAMSLTAELSTFQVAQVLATPAGAAAAAAAAAAANFVPLKQQHVQC
jgi:hypothetical protein